MKTDNTIAAFHIKRSENGALILNTNQIYRWNIPKRLRAARIQKGDIVLVATNQGNRPVLVMDVFREEFEETQRRYRKVIKIIERAPESETETKDTQEKVTN